MFFLVSLTPSAVCLYICRPISVTQITTNLLNWGTLCLFLTLVYKEWQYIWDVHPTLVHSVIIYHDQEERGSASLVLTTYWNKLNSISFVRQSIQYMFISTESYNGIQNFCSADTFLHCCRLPLMCFLCQSGGYPFACRLIIPWTRMWCPFCVET